MMITHIQTSYYKDWNNNLKPLALFWLIWNYNAISLTFIYFLIYICSVCSKHYSEYDYEDDIDT